MLTWLTIKIKYNFLPHNCYMDYHISKSLKKTMSLNWHSDPTSLKIKLIQIKNLSLFPSLINPHLLSLPKNGTPQSIVIISKILQTKTKISENLSNNNPRITLIFSLLAYFLQWHPKTHSHCPKIYCPPFGGDYLI